MPLTFRSQAAERAPLPSSAELSHSATARLPFGVNYSRVNAAAVRQLCLELQKVIESAKCLSDLGGCGKTSVSGGDRFSRAPNPFHVADATA